MLAEVSAIPFQCDIYVATVWPVEVIGVKKVVLFLSVPQSALKRQEVKIWTASNGS